MIGCKLVIRLPRHRRRLPWPSNILQYYCNHVVSSSSHAANSTSSLSTLRYDRETGIIFQCDETTTSSPTASDPALVGESSSSSSPSSTRRRPLYQTIIGIEIHAQLSVPTKLFSSAPTRHHHLYHRRRHHRREQQHKNNVNVDNTNDDDDDDDDENTPPSPNEHVHAIDIAYPGTLPQPISIPTIDASLLSAAVLKCNKINTISRFERKHYFYGDLPLGYQITQQRWPIAQDGLVEFVVPPQQDVAVGVTKAKLVDGGGKEEEEEEVDDHGRGGGTTHAVRRRGMMMMRSSSSSSSSSRNRRELEDNQDHPDDNDNVQDYTSQTKSMNHPIQLRIERIQIEQDTGRTIVVSSSSSSSSSQYSHVDHNRTGCALIEIVSHPDLRSAHEAAGAVSRIRKLLQMASVCDGKMEEGSLRCDLNVSIAPIIDKVSGDVHRYLELPPNTGNRVEVKNLNSIRQIIAATEYEALRQSKLALVGTPTGRETRTLVVGRGGVGDETVCIRAKGDALDYRFMPEPDLPPLILDEETLGCSLQEYVDTLVMEVGESPEEAALRLVQEYGLTMDIAGVITGDSRAIPLFEETVKHAKSELMSLKKHDADGKEVVVVDDKNTLSTLAANWLCNDLFALVKTSTEDGGNSQSSALSVEYSNIDGQRLGALIAMVAQGSLTSSMAKKVLHIMFLEGRKEHPRDIAVANGWQVISDNETLLQLCKSVVFDPKNSSQLDQYKTGEERKKWKIEKYFAGKIMAASRGNAHPELMKETLSVVLNKACSVS